ncbi:MAG TPA: ATP-binding protein [Candidatus Saccharimonadia bacterium]|nr:ATP-binding protein [Candidatus Saccharimonadia bacterium]
MVADKYYKIFRWLVVGVLSFLVIFWLAIHLIGSYKYLAGSYNLHTTTLITSVLGIIYCLTCFNRVAKITNYWQAALIAVLFTDFATLQLLLNIHQSIYFVYLLIWLIIAAFSGMFGYPTVALFNFLTFVFIYFTEGFKSKYMIILAIGSLIVSVSTQLLIWARLQNTTFSRSKSKPVDPLTGIAGEAKSEAETLIDSINEGIVVIDKTSRIILFNPAASEMTDWSIEDAENIDVNLVVKISQEDGKEYTDQTNPFNIVSNTGKKLETTAQLISKDNKRKYIALIVSPLIKGKNINGVAFTMRDISIQKATEQQKMEFISTASHEMRTPVAAIEGYLSLAMNDQISSIDSKAREYLEKAHSSTQQLGRLFQDLLTSSKAEDGRLVNHPEVIEMGEYIGKLAEGFQLAAEKKHLIVDFTLINNSKDNQDPSGKIITPLYFIDADANRIGEVITNIYDNAIKYTETGKITIGLGGSDTDVHFYVQDTGPGIPEDSISHLFEKFYRVDNSAVRTIGGTGLGLYISKKIIELYNGKIWVESQVGKGSTFHITIPRLTQQQADSLKAAQSAQSQIEMPTANL